jgi:hypothetical protein
VIVHQSFTGSLAKQPLPGEPKGKQHSTSDFASIFSLHAYYLGQSPDKKYMDPQLVLFSSFYHFSFSFQNLLQQNFIVSRVVLHQLLSALDQAPVAYAAKIRRIFASQPWQIVHETLSPKNHHKKGLAQGVG